MCASAQIIYKQCSFVARSYDNIVECDISIKIDSSTESSLPTPRLCSFGCKWGHHLLRHDLQALLSDTLLFTRSKLGNFIHWESAWQLNEKFHWYPGSPSRQASQSLPVRDNGNRSYIRSIKVSGFSVSDSIMEDQRRSMNLLEHFSLACGDKHK